MVNKTANGRWRVRVKSRGVVVADRTFVRRGDALRWEAEQTRLLVLGEFVPPSAGKMTVAELAEEYREARRGQLSVRGWESDESALRVHVVPAWGRLPIGSITAAHIERFLSHVATTRSVRTAAWVRSTVRGLFAYAVRTRRLVISPAAAVPLPRPDSRTGQVVEIHPYPLPLLLEVVETQRRYAGRYADVTLVLALTGLRLGELRGLRVKDVASVPYPAIVVHRSVPQSGRTGAPIERATTKSGRIRLIPLSDLVRPVVAEWAHGRRPDGPAVPGSRRRLPHRAELATRRPLVRDEPRPAPARPATYRGQPVDRGRCRHQDGLELARPLDGQAHSRHLRTPHGHRRRPGGHGAGQRDPRGRHWDETGPLQVPQPHHEGRSGALMTCENTSCPRQDSNLRHPL